MRLTPPSPWCWSPHSPEERLSGKRFVFFSQFSILLPPRVSLTPLSFLSDNVAAESKRWLKGQLCCWFCLSQSAFINASTYLPPAVNLQEGLLVALHRVITLSASLQMPLQHGIQQYVYLCAAMLWAEHHRAKVEEASGLCFLPSLLWWMRSFCNYRINTQTIFKACGMPLFRFWI